MSVCEELEHSARSSVRLRGTNEEACNSEVQSDSDDEAVVEESQGLSPKSPSQISTNLLVKGQSSRNTAKGKAIPRRSAVAIAVDSHRHEEELSVLGELEASLMEAPSQIPEISDFPILGGACPPSWVPSDKVLQWYLQVADIDLKSDQLSCIFDQYKSSDQLAEDFGPPKLPDSMWNNIKSTSDAHKFKAVYHTQEVLYTAVKPLLSLLGNLKDSKNKEMCSTAIQLICSSNLQLSRFRRAMASYSINADIKNLY